jgi:hypothetical protein
MFKRYPANSVLNSIDTKIYSFPHHKKKDYFSIYSIRHPPKNFIPSDDDFRDLVVSQGLERFENIQPNYAKFISIGNSQLLSTGNLSYSGGIALSINDAKSGDYLGTLVMHYQNIDYERELTENVEAELLPIAGRKLKYKTEAVYFGPFPKAFGSDEYQSKVIGDYLMKNFPGSLIDFYKAQSAAITEMADFSASRAETDQRIKDFLFTCSRDAFFEVNKIGLSNSTAYGNALIQLTP